MEEVVIPEPGFIKAYFGKFKFYGDMTMIDSDKDYISQILYEIGGNHCKAVEDMLIKTIQETTAKAAAIMIEDGRLSPEEIAKCLNAPIEQTRVNYQSVTMPIS